MLKIHVENAKIVMTSNSVKTVMHIYNNCQERAFVTFSYCSLFYVLILFYTWAAILFECYFSFFIIDCSFFSLLWSISCLFIYLHLRKLRVHYNLEPMYLSTTYIIRRTHITNYCLQYFNFILPRLTILTCLFKLFKDISELKS